MTVRASRARYAAILFVVAVVGCADNQDADETRTPAPAEAAVPALLDPMPHSPEMAPVQAASSDSPTTSSEPQIEPVAEDPQSLEEFLLACPPEELLLQIRAGLLWHFFDVPDSASAQADWRESAARSLRTCVDVLLSRGLRVEAGELMATYRNQAEKFEEVPTTLRTTFLDSLSELALLLYDQNSHDFAPTGQVNGILDRMELALQELHGDPVASMDFQCARLAVARVHLDQQRPADAARLCRLGLASIPQGDAHDTMLLRADFLLLQAKIKGVMNAREELTEVLNMFPADSIDRSNPDIEALLRLTEAMLLLGRGDAADEFVRILQEQNITTDFAEQPEVTP
jgi:hypothetical protein